MGIIEFSLILNGIIENIDSNDMISLQKSISEMQKLLYDVSKTDKYEECLEIFRQTLEHTYLIDSKPKIDYSEAINYSSSMKTDEKANYLVQNLRMVLGEQRWLNIATSPNTHDNLRAPLKQNTYRVQSENFRDEGKAIVDLLNRIHGDKAGMNFRTCPIFEIRSEDEKKEGTKSKEIHEFSIVTIDDKKYIIDLAYRAFFSLTHSSQEKDYIDVGMFMITDTKKRAIAEQILKYGFIEAIPENLKTYMEGFMMMEQVRKNLPAEMPPIEFYESYLNQEKHKSTSEPTYSPKREEFIIDSTPYIQSQSDYSDDYNINMTDEEVLTSIVQKERRHLMKEHDLIHEDLAGACEGSTKRIMLDCTSKGLDDAVFLSPGYYLNKTNEHQKAEGHNCTIVNISGKNYLIDCTYRQFFTNSQVFTMAGEEHHHCGMYMIADEDRKKVAEQILRYGWIEATPENIKAYMDGFEMARNHSFDETGISGDEYVYRLTEHSQFPIHIVTSREIVEADIENSITTENETGVINFLHSVQNIEEKREK